MLLLFLGGTTLARAETRARPEHVPWQEGLSWSEVTDHAVQNGSQPILVDFYAQWCGPCKLLDGFVYNEPEVIRELADVLTFKVDIDIPAYQDLKTHFNITLLPTLIWCDEKGREIDRFTGAVSAQEFLEIIRSFRSGGNTFNRIKDMVAVRPEDPGLLLDLARRHVERGEEDRGRILFRRVMNLRYSTDQPVVLDGMLGLAALEQTSGHPSRARDIARQASDVFGPGQEGAADGLMAVAAFQGTLRDTTGMLDTYRNLIDLDDTNVLALDAYARTAALSGQDLEQATRWAIRAVVYSDDDPRMMETLARCYYQRKQLRQAVRWMEKAVEAAPGDAYFGELHQSYLAELKSKPFLYRGRRR